MNFIKKIFEDKVDEKVHNQFTKFGPGTFNNKAMLDIRVMAKAIKIKTTPEFTNELVEFLANTIKDKVHVKGIIFGTKNLTDECPIVFEEIKNAMGTKKHIVNTELSKEQILEVCENFPFNSINLSFETEYGKLKIKEKAPKAGKAGKGDKKPVVNYCVFTTKDQSILENYAFDIKEPFKKAFITHTLVIDELIVPEEYNDDFSKARIMAKRKGKIIRNLEVDEEEFQNEHDFEV
ncbi:hypothetical protein HOA59_00990 [archaeon]|jgi:hypothetical protein|nr:hypothetical protein [archaeon]MBT6823992.1 hypothetical protein [archaeon]MBT7107225.1 hypothetical protein [archaeon]MBT7297146.1 hypothetical protein [archaeon]